MRFLPIVIDTARSPAFIKWDASLFVPDRLQESQRLTLAHAPVRFVLGLAGLRGLLRLAFAGAFDVAGKFLRWRGAGDRRRGLLLIPGVAVPVLLVRSRW